MKLFKNLTKIIIGAFQSNNYARIDTDGSIRLFGTATAYKDMIGDLFGRRLNSTAGKVDYDFDENAIKFQASGSLANIADRVGANLEINHDFLVGSGITINPHVHWFQDVASNSAQTFTLSMRYRLQSNDSAKTTAWTTTTCNTGTGGDDKFDFTAEADGTYNQISEFPDITINCSISDTLQFQMTRTDSNTGDMLVYFMDIHAEIDGFGSETEYTKS